VQARKNIHTNI